MEPASSVASEHGHGAAWHVRSVFQPVIDLTTGDVVGNEALMRGHGPDAHETPLTLLDRARSAGRLVDLDLTAVRAAGDAASRHARSGTVFVNVEPATLSTARTDLIAALRPLLAQAPVVVEITERALAVDPAGMLEGAEALRAAGCAIALDDVGAEKESLAFIPILRPEVVKLDLGLLARATEYATVAIAGAVRAYAESTGAQVIAEGVEQDEDLLRAKVLGATWGQGWRWGRPAPAPTPAGSTSPPVPPRPLGRTLTASPFEVVAEVRTVQPAPKRLLLPVTHIVEETAMAAPVPPVLLASFQHRRNLTAPTLRRYGGYARHLPFVGVLGQEIRSDVAPGVRGAALHPDDPLAQEWTVSVLGAHEAVALIARERPGPAAGDLDRMFDFTVTHDRELVTAVHHAMVGRLTEVGRDVGAGGRPTVTT